MCGIAGIYSPSPDGPSAEIVEGMLGKMVHRGPDSHGLEIAGPVIFGHRRLKILDLTDAARQPMRSADGRWIIVFNGEIYNYKDIQEELGLRDDELRSRSDTEILLAAWARWGPDALPRLAGQWAFAIYDSHERRLWLTRDRFGEKPLFYHHEGNRLTFASAIPALLQAPWVRREIDPVALAEYATIRYVVGPSTILSGVRKLPGGHLMVVDGNGMRIESWYEPRFRQDVVRRSRDPRELTEEFGHLLAQATRRCLVSDVPVALLFSGGLDSQGVLTAGTREGSDLAAFTYRLSEEWPAETAAEARKDDSGARSEDLVVTQQQRLDRMREVYSSFTEPVGDGASLATWFLIHKARPHATVLLCGHGADEVLGGYRLSQDRFRLAGLRRLAWLPSRKVGEAIGRYCYGDESIPERRRRLRSFRFAEAPAGARFIIHRPLPRGDLADLYHPGNVPAPYLRTIEELYARCAPSAGDLDRIQEVMIKTFLNENILTFADSVAMASSAELRMPYLDRDLVDFVFSLPRRWRVSRWPGHANTKMILREWGRDVLPESVLVEKKRTFNYGNIRFIIRDQRPQLQEMVLGSSALRRALPGLEKWFSNPPEFFHGPREGTLWALLTLSVWCEGAGIR